MIRILFLLAFAFVGCEQMPVAEPKPPSQSESFSEWSVVDCPKCKGSGQMYVGKDSPLIDWGASVGYHECDSCGGCGKMRTNGRGVYTTVADAGDASE